MTTNDSNENNSKTAVEISKSNVIRTFGRRFTMKPKKSIMKIRSLRPLSIAPKAFSKFEKED